MPQPFGCGFFMPKNQDNSLMNKQITPTLNPFSVLVNWSESNEFNEFNEGQLYDFMDFMDFMDFKHKALNVAKQNPLGGYDKTNVTVTFENGDEHQCQLDLGCGGNDTGFAEHCLNAIATDATVLKINNKIIINPYSN